MKILIIAGPTATGKTSLAERLAKLYNGELVSADSRQVYRGMNLSTGKEYVSVPLWLYDVVDPDEEFSVSHWTRLAVQAIADIHARGKLPIVVGGTGLYIRSLLTPLETIDIPPNPALRKRLASCSVQELQAMVPRENMNDSDWNNPRRLIRKIEIRNFNRSPRVPRGEVFGNHDTLLIGLTAPLAFLDARIDARLQQRRAAGLDKEIAKLRKKYRADLPAMSALGINEHAYARRQLTWFKKQPGIVWFDIAKDGVWNDVEKIVGEWYTKR